ncbi:efflux pump antibiotic resistance [Diplodia corticola]|uniref:Efflux pump antibiotic resistance n=1 Tax=Diplodia corticola TaxID=236234 RepID=A0A1J9RX49_9PEZI|nr:efflux pump antibiotic resistance [Diplodia corticola]OJD32061.1 efflux pump antibiotic resistance [Diplodia corticola]
MDSTSTSATRVLDIEAAGAKSADDGGPSPTCASSVEPDAEKGSPAEDADQQPARTYSTWQWALILAAIYASQFLYGLDTTIVADIQSAVVEEFDQIGQLGWLGVGYPLGSVATILTFGKAYGIFDIKWLYTGSLTMFTAGSALCGAAPNMNALIVGRVWAGAGGAGMYLGVMNLLTVNTAMHERAIYISTAGAIWGAGCILGPVIGGSFADSSAGWRWAFYLNLILYGLFLPVILFGLKPFSFQPDKPFMKKLAHLDWLGIFLNAAVYTVFVTVFTFAGSEWAWDAGQTIALFVILGVLIISFVASQYFTILTDKERRLFPGDFLRNKNLILLYISQSCATTTLFIPIYYIPLFCQFVYGDSGISSAVRLLPFICIAVFANLLQGATASRVGYYMPLFLIASILGTIGGTLFYAELSASTPPSHIYGFSAILGIAAGLSQTVAYSVAPTETAPERVADAVGFINTAQIGSTVAALTITSAVFQNVGRKHVAAAVAGLGFTDAEIASALAGQRAAVFERMSEQVREKVIAGIASTICDAFVLITVAGALGTVVALFLKRERLSMEGAVGGA